MAEYSVGPREGFEHRRALAAMLRLLHDLLKEIWQDRELLFPRSFQGPPPEALEIALARLRDLMGIVENMEVSPDRLDDFGLRGEPLYFKLQVVEAANNAVGPARNRALERVADGRSRRRWWVYRWAVKATLEAIDGPLESLTKMLGVAEGIVEFKKAVEVLLGIRNDLPGRP